MLVAEVVGRLVGDRPVRWHHRRNVTAIVVRWYTVLLAGLPLVAQAIRSASVRSAGWRRPLSRKSRCRLRRVSAAVVGLG